MTSKPSTGGGDGGSKEKRKWNESKVYSRKSLTPKISSKKIPNSSKTAAAAAAIASDDDSSSLNRRQQQFQVPNSSNRDPPPSTMDGFVMRSENRITINISSGLKQDLRELRKKLSKELDQVRNFVKKLEAKEKIQLSGYSHSQLSTNYAIEAGGGGGKRGKSKAKNLHRLSLSAAEESQGGTSEIVQKEKRGPKTNQVYYQNSEFLNNGKEKTPLPPPESNKKAKTINGGKKHGGEGNVGFGKDNKQSAKIFKSCNDLLTKLMKHKHGWVFNTPVDVKGLGLRDYFIIIKHPMDLGTVKARLSKNGYKSPMDFAEDVKLTFHNAMTYNRKGQDVHIMAEELLKIFEDKWAVIQAELNLSSRIGGDHEVDPPPPPHSITKVPKKKNNTLPPPEMRRNLDRSESTTRPVDSQMKAVDVPPSGKNPPLKKPKVNDINKRDMTYDEKQRLSTSLQSLPLEKLDNIVQIIKNRNSSLFQNDDEIEVDIDSVDVETLWELDRFVTNYKKGLSKNKKKAETAIPIEESEHKVMEMDPAPTIVEAPNETETVFNANEKDVSSSSPVQGEKRGDVASRSSSSSSSSSDSGSSSSDSDSDSSSASDT